MASHFKIGDKVVFKGHTAVGEVIKIHNQVTRYGITCEVLWSGNKGTTIHYQDSLELYNANSPCLHGKNANTCYECPIKITLPENWDIVFSIKLKKCECGTKNAIGQGHSQWCALYRKEF